jgi:ribosomal protein S5
MTKKLPSGLRGRLGANLANSRKHLSPQSEKIVPGKTPFAPRIGTDIRGKGIRNTSFRLPYLSNLRKMDPVFDDPYDVAAQTIRNTRKPGDPEVILDPDGVYEEDDGEGDDGRRVETNNLPANLQPTDRFTEYDQSQRFRALMAATGMTMEYIQQLMQRALVYNYVTNQIRTGKVRSMYCLMVVGNGDGIAGYGEGKSEEPSVARDMALIQAIKSMVPVDRYENRTVYGETEAKFGSSRVCLRARPPGFGIRANYFVHEICRCAGITDVGAKVRGSMNGMNIVKAVFQALRQQKSPSVIAKQRGVHVIDVRERYFQD